MAKLGTLAAFVFTLSACSSTPVPTNTCQSTTDCPSGYTCNRNLCYAPKASGGPGTSTGASTTGSQTQASSGTTAAGASSGGAGATTSAGSAASTSSSTGATSSAGASSTGTSSGGVTSGGSSTGAGSTGSSTGSASGSTGSSTGGGCVTACNAGFTCDANAGFCKSSAGVPQLSNVWVIVMENTNYADINASTAPYISGTLMTQGVAMNNYFAVVHPSLPNYIAMVGGDNFGLSSDGAASDPAYQIPSGTPNIALQLEAAGLTWHEYSESQQTACALADTGTDSSATGHFVSKHNPMSHFLDTQNSASCAANDVSYEAVGSMPGIAADLAASHFYNYVFISPNLCDDGHDLCGSAPSKAAEQDAWLQTNLSQITNSAGYQHNGVVIITWDEDDNTGGMNQIATLILSPMLATPGTPNNTLYSHYSALATIEAGFGLSNLPAANGHTDALITDIWK